MINSLTIKNFKCFEDLHIELSNLNVLAGINSMGKSNEMNKPKVRTLEKPQDNAGIIDIRIMIYVIVNVLLIWVIFNILTK